MKAAKHLAGSNTGGGYGYLDGSGEVIPTPLSLHTESFIMDVLCVVEGKAVVLNPPKKYGTPPIESQVKS